jgi:UDP-2,3-diacylglucosamine pyrophosphatase LpxH
MEKTRRVFLSDIHLSSKEIYEHKDEISWFKPPIHEARLTGFLKNYVIKNKDQIKDVILLGDVFNTWVCPANKTPPTFDQIFSANREVLATFRAVIKAGIGLFYCNGNHDFDLRRDVIETKVKGIHFIQYYRTGRIHAEHGHRFDIYNKPDFVTDPAFGRPIGYYISRLVTSANGGGYGILDLASYLDDIIEAALTSQNIFSSIIEGLAEQAGLSDKGKIRMPGGKSITVGELKERYERLSGVYSQTELISDLYQRRYLNGPADRLCGKNDFQVVVFGHTHNAMLDKDFFLVEDRIYANTGSWCKEHAYCVEIDKGPSSLPTKVMLHKVTGKGKIEETKEAEV